MATRLALLPDRYYDVPGQAPSDEVSEQLIDETPFGRDPFDVIAAIEEQLGHPIYDE